MHAVSNARHFITQSQHDVSVTRTAAKPYSWLDKKVADQERKSIANMVFVLIFEYPKKERRLLPLALPEAVNRLASAD